MGDDGRLARRKIVKLPVPLLYLKDYASYVRLYNERDEIPPILFHRYYPDIVEDYLIRSLLRLGRCREAEKVAQDRDNHADWYLMTVYAVRGEPERAMPLLDRCLEEFSIHDDWIAGNQDLWEALQKPEYREWLEAAIAREDAS
ncbi:MAG: hypothetical protein CMO55_25470 [Verrucomicrobiales bacterium]|nr:hypothetical protein [Verrucomicrobiales bacterium]